MISILGTFFREVLCESGDLECENCARMDVTNTRVWILLHSSALDRDTIYQLFFCADVFKVLEVAYAKQGNNMTC